MVKYISCDCKCKFNSATWISNQKWINETCQCECKMYCTCKKNYSWDSSTCICENGRHLRSIADTSVIACYEIIYVMDIVSKNLANTISINVTSTASINYKEVRYKMGCYILHAALLVIILLFIIAIMCYHYAKHRST